MLAVQLLQLLPHSRLLALRTQMAAGHAIKNTAAA
jgi:hypothetical protein